MVIGKGSERDSTFAGLSEHGRHYSPTPFAVCYGGNLLNHSTRKRMPCHARGKGQ
jgi:hypothetical protein